MTGIAIPFIFCCLGFALLLEGTCYATSNLRWRKAILPLSLLGAITLGGLIAGANLFRAERPVGSVGGWLLVLSFGLTCCSLYFQAFYPKRPFGIFLLPFVLLLIVASVPLQNFPFSSDRSCQFLRAFHGMIFILTLCFALTGFVSGMLFTFRRRRLRSNHGNFGGGGATLPSLEWLETANRRSVKLMLCSLLFGILSGFHLMQTVEMPVDNHPLRLLFDPMIGGAIALFIAMVIFWRFGVRRQSPHKGTNVALMTIICFVVLLILVAFGVFSQSAHWYGKEL